MRIADDSTLIRQFPKQDAPISAVAFSPDGSKVAVGAEVGDVRVYDTESGNLIAKCCGHEGGVYTLQFHPSGQTLAAAGFDGTVRVFDLGGNLLTAYVPVPIGTGQVATK
jgi:WD40 repeat protein